MAEDKKRSSRSSKSRRGKDSPAQGELIQGTKVRTGLIRGTTFHHKPVTYLVRDGLALFEGDIVLGTEEEMEQLTAELQQEATGAVALGVGISGARFRWPNCTVPFRIDPGLPDQARVTDAIAHWQAHTNYRFVARTNEADFVTFRRGTDCSSSVGRRGGEQFVNLGPNCNLGNAIHEIGHTIGLWHEQSRQDRDQFVTIHFDRVKPGLESNFTQHIADGDDIGPYDYGSIMHYPRTAFSVDGVSETITPVDPTATIGQRTGLSAGDIAAVNSFCVPKPPIEDAGAVLKNPVVDQLLTGKEPVRDVGVVHKNPVLDRLLTGKEPVQDVEVRHKPPLEGLFTHPRVGGFGGRVPFMVGTPHHAPLMAAGTPEQGDQPTRQLYAALEALAEQLAQVEAQRTVLQAQYEAFYAQFAQVEAYRVALQAQYDAIVAQLWQLQAAPGQ